MKKTIEDVKMYLINNNRNFIVISDTYKTCKDKLLFKCNICGNEWRATFDSISNSNTGCPNCAKYQRSKKKALKYETVIERIKSKNPNIKVLTKTYNNRKGIVECECLIDGYKWSTTWDSIIEGSNCPCCTKNKLRKIFSLTLDDVKNRLKIINPNIIILSNEYDNNSTKVLCKCLKDGYEWETTVNNLIKCKSPTGCPQCAGNKSWDINALNNLSENIEVLNIFNKKNGNRNRRYLKCFCKIHNYEWNCELSSFTRGISCPICGLRTGELNGCWKGGITSIAKHLRNITSSWIKDSLEYNKYSCDISNSTKEIEVHHLYSFNLILQETFDILNMDILKEVKDYSEDELKKIEETFIKLHNDYGLGICLEHRLHREFHNIYGYGNNTPEQYEEFKKIKNIKISRRNFKNGNNRKF